MRYVPTILLSFVFNDLRHNKFWYSGSIDGYLAQFRYSRCLCQLGTGSASTVESAQYQLSGRSAAW